MAETYRVLFAGIANDTTSEQAGELLAAKLKTSPAKIDAFFKNKPLFAPSTKEKALKQAKLLASVGIKSKLQASNLASNETMPTQLEQGRDERIFDALDYITSSLIRLEEKLDDIEQRLPTSSNHDSLDNDDDWQQDDLLLDEELEQAPSKRNNTLLYTLIALVVILLITLGVFIAFPDLITF